MKEERDEYKRQFEMKDREQSKMNSKIRALEMVINTNGSSSIEQRTPIHHNFAPPTPQQPQTTRINRVVVQPNSGPRATAASAAQTPSHQSRPIGSITNSAAFNRFQTPMRNATNTPAVTNSRDKDQGGLPVANRRQQRRSKSADLWLDHKPPATPQTG